MWYGTIYNYDVMFFGKVMLSYALAYPSGNIQKFDERPIVSAVPWRNEDFEASTFKHCFGGNHGELLLHGLRQIEAMWVVNRDRMGWITYSPDSWSLGVFDIEGCDRMKTSLVYTEISGVSLKSTVANRGFQQPADA